MLAGLITAIVLVSISPNVIHPEAGKAFFVGDPIFPLTNPALISVPAGFIGGLIGTLVSAKRDEKKYAEVTFKANTGYKEAEM